MVAFENLNHPSANWLSEHAAIRAKQRGILPDALELLRKHWDTEIPAVLGRVCRSISRHGARELLTEGYSIKHVENAQKFQLIMEKNGLVITVLAAHFERRSRRHARLARRRNRARGGRK